ncbi:cupin domain-containing protein [Sphingobium sp.]|uniref:cupin domain-containing protein n=1 Tax=Sphingobium sp. TaxID=1912891 RepID=UPI003B3B95C7
MVEAVMTDGAARQALADELSQFNVRIAQQGDRPLFTTSPQPSMVPLQWRAPDIARLLEKIGHQVKLESGGQRRTLRLTNPGLDYGTTPTFWCSIQYILPGEIASCHRHSPTALRFIMSGAGARTTVDGERYEMNEGDLVLTPSMTWHDHEHLGDAPMVWLDVLDISLVRALDATFFEGSAQDLQPLAAEPQRGALQYGSGLMQPFRHAHVAPSTPVPVYEWGHAIQVLQSAEALTPDPYFDTAFEYQNPLNGGPALSTIGTALQRLRPGMQGRPHRNTGSTVLYVVRGNGTLQTETDMFEWSAGDFMAIPSWCLHHISNRSSSDDAVLFHVNDRPALSKLGLYREEFI